MTQKLFEVKAYGKEKIPYSYYATKEDVENKSLRTARPSTRKNKYGHYQHGRIVAVRAE
jgi:hypothetical protein